MTKQWTELSDEELARVAQDGLQGQGAPVEAMRRLRIAIEQSSAKSDTYSRRMWGLTVVLAVLTLIQAIAAFIQATAAIPAFKVWLESVVR
jgi:hypothetical protein